MIHIGDLALQRFELAQLRPIRRQVALLPAILELPPQSRQLGLPLLDSLLLLGEDTQRLSRVLRLVEGRLLEIDELLEAGRFR